MNSYTERHRVGVGFEPERQPRLPDWIRAHEDVSTPIVRAQVKRGTIKDNLVDWGDLPLILSQGHEVRGVGIFLAGHRERVLRVTGEVDWGSLYCLEME